MGHKLCQGLRIHETPCLPSVVNSLGVRIHRNYGGPEEEVLGQEAHCPAGSEMCFSGRSDVYKGI